MNTKHDKRTKQHKPAKRPSPGRPRARTRANTNVGRKPATRKNKPAHKQPQQTPAEAAVSATIEGVTAHKSSRQRQPTGKEVALALLQQFSDDKDFKAAIESLHREQHPAVQPVVYTGAQKLAALNLLSDPDLLTRYRRIIQNQVSGQTAMLRAGILMLAGRLVIKPLSLCSNNLCIQGTRGRGKSFICENLIATLPGDQVESCGRISPTAVAYDHSNDLGWTWDGKVLLVNDIGNTLLNDQCVKLFLSGELGKQKITYEGKVVDINIVGKPTVLVNLVRAYLSDEQQRRIARVKVRVTNAQADAIFDRAADIAEHKITPTRDFDLLRCANGLLRRVEVDVPYAHRAKAWFAVHKNTAIGARMELLPAYQGFIDLCKASAALHQMQRTPDGHGRIAATGDDYELARLVFATLHFGADPVDRLRGDIEVRLFTMLQDSDEPMTVGQLVADSGYSRSNVQTKLGELEKRGLIIQHDSIPTKGRPINLWCVNPSLWEKPEPPDFETLMGQKS